MTQPGPTRQVDHQTSDGPEERPRHTISEVAERTGLSAHTLRWYERIGLMPHIDRTHTGQRRFSDRDMEWLDLVGKLRLTGMAVADMVRYAELIRAGEETLRERLLLLSRTREEARRKIAGLRETMAVLDYKIDHYESKIDRRESGVDCHDSEIDCHESEIDRHEESRAASNRGRST
ncbi:MerR family transcriptional regulator [Streptomyces sp. P38-E01]|uniref:MerR family transcriptional regulator n=1 Tax=Streptomyces tardus TaxID=2780544 RepID=A0A949JH01_9ACTN|nr:MerR family transcriptional regulator [Streptomyces tardus]